MRALLDEQLSALIAAELRSRDLDVEAVTERADLMRKSDREILDAASAEGRAVVTNNVKDFRPLAAHLLAEGGSHAGLILLPATRSRRRDAISSLADGIEEIMCANPNGLRDSERWVAPTS